MTYKCISPCMFAFLTNRYTHVTELASVPPHQIMSPATDDIKTSATPAQNSFHFFSKPPPHCNT